MISRTTPPARDRDYLAYVRDGRCLGCMREADVMHAHHLERAGIALKGSDYMTVRLCAICHTEIHAIGRERFEAENRVNLYREALRLLERWHSRDETP